MVEKLFIGQRVRRLRASKDMTQIALAQRLGLSASYLNQIENNQRPMTLAVLLRLCALFNLDAASFAEDEGTRLVADLREVLGDPVVAGGRVTTTELREVAAASPELVRRFLALHQAHQKLRERIEGLAESLADGGGSLAGPSYPYDEVRDYFHYRDNYMGPLDEAAERLAADEGFTVGAMLPDLARYLSERHGVTIAIADEAAPMRSFDAASRRLTLSPQLDGSSRAFQLGYQIALLAAQDTIDGMVEDGRFATADARSICRVGLANYFASALIMPYSVFHAEARAMRHDIERLQTRFGASFEQICHRLSTLQRPGLRGVPFYFVRVDSAGNITKRHSATRFQFARFGGACPLWNVHEAFAQPGKILVQLARMPDDTQYLSIARTVHKPGGGYLKPSRLFAVGLGCEASYAPDLVYSAGIDVRDVAASVNIGVSCRVCERTDCQQRAFPPIGSRISVDESRRRFVPYEFDFAQGEKDAAAGRC